MANKFTEQQYIDAGQWLSQKLAENDSESIEKAIIELGLTPEDLLIAAQTVAPNLTLDDSTQYFQKLDIPFTSAAAPDSVSATSDRLQLDASDNSSSPPLVSTAASKPLSIDQISSAYQQYFGRAPSAAELQSAAAFQASPGAYTTNQQLQDFFGRYAAELKPAGSSTNPNFANQASGPQSQAAPLSIDQISSAYQQYFGRLPTAAELEAAIAFQASPQAYTTNQQLQDYFGRYAAELKPAVSTPTVPAGSSTNPNFADQASGPQLQPATAPIQYTFAPPTPRVLNGLPEIRGAASKTPIDFRFDQVPYQSELIKSLRQQNVDPLSNNAGITLLPNYKNDTLNINFNKPPLPGLTNKPAVISNSSSGGGTTTPTTTTNTGGGDPGPIVIGPAGGVSTILIGGRGGVPLNPDDGTDPDPWDPANDPGEDPDPWDPENDPEDPDPWDPENDPNPLMPEDDPDPWDPGNDGDDPDPWDPGNADGDDDADIPDYTNDLWGPGNTDDGADSDIPDYTNDLWGADDVADIPDYTNDLWGDLGGIDFFDPVYDFDFGWDGFDGGGFSGGGGGGGPGSLLNMIQLV